MDQQVIICDLDGTIASCEWRRHFVEPEPPSRHKDWTSFFRGIPFDPVVPEVKKMLEDYEANGFKIVYVSARPDYTRPQTIAWLTKHSCPGGPPFELYMRASGDSRHDPEVKQDILNGALAKYFKAGLIHKVVDDRPQVIEMWKRNGLDVHQVYDPGLKPAIFRDADGEGSDAAYASVSRLLEEAAMRIVLAGLKETNMIQVLVADEMHMELLQWVTEFAAKFRYLYEHKPDVKQAIDAGQMDPELVKRLAQMLQQPGIK